MTSRGAQNELLGSGEFVGVSAGIPTALGEIHALDRHRSPQCGPAFLSSGPRSRELEMARPWLTPDGRGRGHVPKDQIEQFILRLGSGTKLFDEECEFISRLRRIDRH